MQIQKILLRLGFSLNETKAYTATLELGVASVQSIARKAGLKRTTTYMVLDSLVERGVVGKTMVKGAAKFLAEPPEKLLSIVRELEHQIKKDLPELDAIYNRNEVKPKITFYEGVEGIKNVFEDTIREKPAEILMWLSDDYFKQLPGYSAEYIKRRTALDMHAKRICTVNSIWHRKNQKRDAQELSETVAVPRDAFDINIEVNVYNNKLAFMNFRENIGIIIESKAIADAMRQAYALSWKGAKAQAAK